MTKDKKIFQSVINELLYLIPEGQDTSYRDDDQTDDDAVQTVTHALQEARPTLVRGTRVAVWVVVHPRVAWVL